MKKVIYKSMGVFYVTDSENYNARIQDANKIQRMDGFKSPEEIINYYCKWCKKKPEDFEVAC